MPVLLPEDIKKVISLLKNKSNDYFEDFIIDSETFIFNALAGKYYIPFESADEIQLKVNVNNNSDIVIASNSNFNNYNKNDYISINNDVFLIKQKNSLTEIQVNRNLTYSENDINALFFPRDIVFVIKYFAVKLALMKDFSEQAYNQDTIPFFKTFDSLCNPIIKSIFNGTWTSSRIKRLGSGSDSSNNKNDILPISSVLRINVKKSRFRSDIDCNSNSINRF